MRTRKNVRCANGLQNTRTKLRIWGSGVRIPSGAPPSVAAREFLPAIFFASRHRRKQLGSNARSQKKFRLSKWWVSPRYMDRPLRPCRRVSRDPAETQPTKIPNGILKVNRRAPVAASRHQTATRALMSAIGGKADIGLCAAHVCF